MKRCKRFYNYNVSQEGLTILRQKSDFARDDVPPLVPAMDPKKRRVIPLNPEIATDDKIQ
jgi:hypothetical protein